MNKTHGTKRGKKRRRVERKTNKSKLQKEAMKQRRNENLIRGARDGNTTKNKA